MVSTEERNRLVKAQQAIGYSFKNEELLLAAITHPSAVEGFSIERSYERMEFLGDSVLGFIVARTAYERFEDLDEGGLTRIKVALVAGSTLSEVGQELGFQNIILFGDSEMGTGKRGMHSALENVYESIVAAIYLDGGLDEASAFISRTLLPRMTRDFAIKPENPKSALQERLQEDGITPTYELVETQGPPHDRTFVSQVFAGVQSLARGVGRTKKEAESKAADTALKALDKERQEQAKAQAQAKKEHKAEVKAAQKAEKDRHKVQQRMEKERQKARQQADKNARKNKKTEEAE